MSAYIVSEKHVLTLAYYYNKMVKGNEGIDLKKTARVLWSENTKSVNYRYNERSNARFSKELVLPKTDCEMAELYKLISCWEYQTCEHPTCTKSKAWSMMQELKSAMLDYIMRNTQPFSAQYENAEWGMY
jgi:hypothetical protein